MKILQVMAGDTFGGAENFFMRLVKSLKNVGVDQHVVIKSHDLREKDLHDHGLPVTTASFNRNIPFTTRSKIKSIAKDFQPDIVLSWMSRASDLCPKGDFVHVARLGGYYDLKYYKKCDHLVGNTHDIVDYFLGEKWPEQNSHYLPNFADLPTSKKKIDRAQFDTPEDAPLLLTLGRLHDDKAFDVLIKAMPQIPGAYLWIAGVGEELSKLQNLAKQHRVEDRVKFIGWHEDISALYNTCDIYVCPSRIEPLGNVVLEGWTHKKPVVASKSKGPKALITHNETGLLSELEDWEGMALNINRLIENPSLMTKLVKNAYTHYIDTFSEEIVVKKYLDFFERVKGKKRR